MPLQNRVTPLGELVAEPGRGLVYGNRGCLHDDRGRIRRRYAGERWIACHVARRRPSQELGAEHEERDAVAQDERPVREVRQTGFVEAVAARPRFDPFGVELRVDRVRPDLAGMDRTPDLAEMQVVHAATERARAVT